MALRDLFGKAKSTAKKAGKQAKRAENYGQRVYDREVEGAFEAHERGSEAVGEYGQRAFGLDRDEDDDSPTPMDVALGTSMDMDDRDEFGMASSMDDDGMGMPDPLGGREPDTNDDWW